MSVSTTVRGAGGRFGPYVVGKSHGCLMNQCGVKITEFIGDKACNNIMETLSREIFESINERNDHIMELVRFQDPVIRTIHSLVNEWGFYQRELRIQTMLYNMTFSVPINVVQRDIDSVFDMWEATGFNLDMRWEHANYRWVGL
jgi:hypothetical protein